MYPIGNSNHLAKQPASTGHCTAVNAPSVGLAEKWQPEIPGLLQTQEHVTQRLVELVEVLAGRLSPVMTPDHCGAVGEAESTQCPCTEIGGYLRGNIDRTNGVIHRLEGLLGRIHL